LIHTPPSLCSTADPVSAATSVRGHRTAMIQQRKHRKADTLIPKSNFHKILLKMVAGGSQVVY
jgi:hypothetical protein